MITVVAVREFQYQGRLIHRGEGVDLTPLDAAIQHRAHNVTLDSQARPTYIARDMAAVEPVSVVVLPEPVIEPAVVLPKRRTRRRKKA